MESLFKINKEEIMDGWQKKRRIFISRIRKLETFRGNQKTEQPNTIICSYVPKETVQLRFSTWRVLQKPTALGYLPKKKISWQAPWRVFPRIGQPKRVILNDFPMKPLDMWTPKEFQFWGSEMGVDVPYLHKMLQPTEAEKMAAAGLVTLKESPEVASPLGVSIPLKEEDLDDSLLAPATPPRTYIDPKYDPNYVMTIDSACDDSFVGSLREIDVGDIMPDVELISKEITVPIKLIAPISSKSDLVSFYKPNFIGLSEEKLKEWVDGSMSIGFFLDGNLAGAVTFRELKAANVSFLDVLLVAVDSKMRRQGIGSQLLAEVETYCHRAFLLGLCEIYG